MFDSIKSFFATTKSDASAPFYPYQNSERNLKELSRTDYLRLYQSWVYLAVSTIGDSLANLNYVVERNGKEIETPIKDLITPSLLRYVASQMLITGTAYVWKRTLGKKVDSFDYLRSDTVILEENSDGSLKSYRYTGGRQQIELQKEAVMDFSLFNPLLTYPYTLKGVSPVSAIAVQAEMDRVANRWNWNFFRNGARPGDILQTEAEMSKENKELIVRKWKDQYGGAENAHKVAVLDNGLKYVSVGVNKKELDFVEGRRFTRDEILAIFKLPPSVIGITDNANRASAQVALETYFRVCIEPLASQIAEVITKELFAGVGVFKFTNIIPADSEQLAKDLQLGAISINEYRAARGYNPMPGYDDIAEAKPEVAFTQEPTKFQKEIYSSIAKHVKGTAEYVEEREAYGKKKWEAKIKRTNPFEIRMEKEIKYIFDKQKSDVIASLTATKGMTKRIEWKKPEKITWATMWASLVPIYRDIFVSEGTSALHEVGVTGVFQTGNPRMNKYIKDMVGRVSKSANDTTIARIEDIVKEGNDQGLGADAMARAITAEFDTFSRVRATMIARTETTTAANNAEIDAWKSSGVVEWKEWYTSIDERVCKQCGKMHKKVIKVDEDFFKKGDTFQGEKLDYSDVKGPALHPSCRCTLLPVLK